MPITISVVTEALKELGYSDDESWKIAINSSGTSSSEAGLAGLIRSPTAHATNAATSASMSRMKAAMAAAPGET